MGGYASEGSKVGFDRPNFGFVMPLFGFGLASVLGLSGSSFVDGKGLRSISVASFLEKKVI